MSDLSVVAVGGGAPDKRAAPLLTQGLDFTGVEKQPHALIITSAKTTQEAHDKSVAAAGRLYGSLGIPYEVLHEFGQMPSTAELDEKLEWADVTYIAGGDTGRMMDIWREHGIEEPLRTRALGGLVLTGISAGAIAPFSVGHSDSISFRVAEGEPWDYMLVDGLDLVPGIVTPHSNTSPTGQRRSELFHAALRTMPCASRIARFAFGIDNGASLQVHDDVIQAVTAPGRDTGVEIIDLTADTFEPRRLEPGERISINLLTV